MSSLWVLASLWHLLRIFSLYVKLLVPWYFIAHVWCNYTCIFEELNIGDWCQKMIIFWLNHGPYEFIMIIFNRLVNKAFGMEFIIQRPSIVARTNLLWLMITIVRLANKGNCSQNLHYCYDPCPKLYYAPILFIKVTIEFASWVQQIWLYWKVLTLCFYYKPSFISLFNWKGFGWIALGNWI